jgi:glycosyltransferase involved in cell wall biosynthesis
MKIIALMPVYNESRHIEGVLNKIEKNVDFIILVNDGSVDGTEEKVLKWGADKREKLYYLKLKKNLGMAKALRHGFMFVARLLAEKKIEDSDIIVTIDADGQHDPDYIPAMIERFRKNNLDILLAKRDFSGYPRFRRLGNAALTLYSSILSGYRYHDVECGFRLLKAFIVPIILQHYYVAYRYSQAQIIAITTARLHYKINNDFTIIAPYYRQGGPRIFDALVHIAISTYVFLRLMCVTTTPTTCAYESSTY